MREGSVLLEFALQANSPGAGVGRSSAHPGLPHVVASSLWSDVTPRRDLSSIPVTSAWVRVFYEDLFYFGFLLFLVEVTYK